MKIIKLINLENVTEEEVSSYRIREAARAIVFDENAAVALLHARKHGYYKLPGGGLEGTEDRAAALNRECKEEIGCSIEVTGEVGSIVEYRSKFKLKQTSYCYTAKVVGQKGIAALMPDEIEEGFETVWLPFKEALEKVANSSREVYEAAYMVTRDLAFLQAIKI